MKKSVTKRVIILIACAALVLTAAVGTTAAYMMRRTLPLFTGFEPAEVSCEVVVDGGDVRVVNTGDTSAYIRAAVVVTYKNADGEIYAKKQPVEGIDYVLGTSRVWMNANGYYYHKLAVEGGESTEALVSSIDTVSDTLTVEDAYGNIEVYYLTVDVAASAIQSEPASAVSDYWNVSVNGLGELYK